MNDPDKHVDKIMEQVGPAQEKLEAMAYVARSRGKQVDHLCAANTKLNEALELYRQLNENQKTMIRNYEEQISLLNQMRMSMMSRFLMWINNWAKS